MIDDNQQNQPKQDERPQKINNLILSNEDFLVVANSVDFDTIAAASGLALLLKSLGKRVTLYSAKTIMPADFSPLSGVDQFTEKMESNTNKLMITFDCPINQIERVASDDKGEKLSLSVEFKNGIKAISPDKVHISTSGPKYSVGFVLGTDFQGEEEITREGKWVWFSRSRLQKPWAEINMTEEKATLSESVVSAISRGGYEIPKESLENFYQGIKTGTGNFDSADSIALETAAYCLRIKESIEAKAKPYNPKPTEAPVMESVEKKEDDLQWQSPPIFTGTTTPKV